MKKNPLFVVIVSVVSGMILGATAISWLSFINVAPSPAAVSGAIKISVQDAQQYTRKYLERTAPTNQVIRGFSVNKEQLDALNRLAAENPSLTGFRIYLGMDNSFSSLGMVIGVDNSGKDYTTSIYRTSAGASGPCPPICDQSSSILSN
jgi:hypothetical protein